jgi:GH15 family glucan-1,4-alpha-glucosidase
LDGTLPKFIPESESGDLAEETPQPTSKAIAGHERIGRVLRPDSIDGSALLVLGPFGPFQSTDPIISKTLLAIEDTLVVESGVHRYLEDEFYGGGLWIVLAGALACVQAREDPKRANETLEWIEAQADAAGHLGEQSSSHLRKPESLEPWVQRWGPPARPLLWSHAMYLLGVSALEPDTVGGVRLDGISRGAGE